MTFVVGEDCIKCKHTDCVEVCPVDCFYEGPNFLVIHPDECIDCALRTRVSLSMPSSPRMSYPEIRRRSCNLTPNSQRSGPTSQSAKNPPLTQRTGRASPASWSYWSVGISTDWAAARSGSLAARRGVSRSAASLNPHRCCPCGRSPAPPSLARLPRRAVHRYGHTR